MDANEYGMLAIHYDEMAYLLDAVKDQYKEDAFLAVHVSVMIVPRLKEMGIFKPVVVTNPKFRISSREIALALRIAGNARYGLMHRNFLEMNGVYTDDDVNKMLMAMYQIRHRDSFCLFEKWDIEPFNFDKALSVTNGLLAEDVFDEVEMCDKIFEYVFSRYVVTFNKFNLDKLRKSGKNSPLTLSIRLASELGVDSVPYLEQKKHLDMQKGLFSSWFDLFDKLTDAYSEDEEDDD